MVEASPNCGGSCQFISTDYPKAYQLTLQVCGAGSTLGVEFHSCSRDGYKYFKGENGIFTFHKPADCGNANTNTMQPEIVIENGRTSIHTSCSTPLYLGQIYNEGTVDEITVVGYCLQPDGQCGSVPYSSCESRHASENDGAATLNKIHFAAAD